MIIPFFRFHIGGYLFLFSSVICIAWIIQDWYITSESERKPEKYLLMTILAIQGCISAWYVFHNEAIKALLAVLSCTGLYVLFYVLIRCHRNQK